MKKDRRGVAIIIVLMVSAAILGIGLGISSIVFKEIRISAPIDESVGAIMAADAGMERKLYDVRKLGGDPLLEYPEITLPNSASFTACDVDLPCTSTSVTTLYTQGKYRATRRSWQAQY